MERFIESLEQILIRRRTYVILSALFVAYCTAGQWTLAIAAGSDFWEHLASVNAFSRNLGNPANPYMMSDAPTHLFTPFHLAWGAMARLVNLHPIYLMPLIALASSTAFVIGVRLAAKHIIGDERSASLLLLVMLSFWLLPPEWSGFFHWGMVPVSLTYPYWLSLGVGLVLISVYRPGNYGLLVAVIIAAPLLFLVHTITGTFVVGALALRAALSAKATQFQRALFVLTPVAAVGLAFLWPYFSLWEVVRLSQGTSFGGAYPQFYDDAFPTLLPGLTALIFLPTLFRDRSYRFIVVGLSGVTAVWILNAVTIQSSVFGRYLIYLVWFLQLTIVAGLWALFIGKSRPQIRAAFYLLAVVLFVIFIPFSGQSFGPAQDLVNRKSLGESLVLSQFGKLREMQDFLTESQVLMADPQTSWRAPGSTGVRVVGMLHRTPFMTQAEAVNRIDAIRRFYSPQVSSDQREDILEEFGVTRILISVPDETNLIAGLSGSTNLLWEGGGLSLYSYQGTHTRLQIEPEEDSWSSRSLP